MQSIDILRQLAVLDRDRIEQVLHDLIELRTNENVEAFSKLAAPNIVLEVVGDPRHFGPAGRYPGKVAAMDVLRRMIIDVIHLDYEILDQMIDHDKAMVRRIVRARHRGTGITLEHEIWDLVQFEDGMISRITKFVDMHASMMLLGPG